MPGFFQHGNSDTDLSYDYESYLVGDREGFMILRDKLGEVINGQDEVTFTDDVDTSILGIRCANQISPRQNHPWIEKYSPIGCLLALALVILLSILGTWKAAELLTPTKPSKIEQSTEKIQRDSKNRPDQTAADPPGVKK